MESALEAFAASGNNLGNFAFAHGAAGLVDDHIVPFTYWDDPSEVREAVEVLLIPEANLISTESNYVEPAKFLEECGLPTLTIGIGIQAKSSLSEIQLAPGTERFLKVLAASGPVLSRGTQSSEFLNELGIDSVPFGCPSYLIAPPGIFVAMEQRLEACSFPATLAVFEGLVRDSSHRWIDQRLFEYATLPGNRYIAQGDVVSVRMSDGVNQSSELVWAALAPDVDLSVFTEKFRQSARAFADVPSWIRELRHYDFATGMRIHGAILGVQAGCPTVLLTHDLRTQELAEQLRLPLVKASGLSPERPLLPYLFKALTDQIGGKGAELDAHRSLLAQLVLKRIKEQGLEPSARLVSLAGFVGTESPGA